VIHRAHVVIIVFSTSHAMKIEKRLKARGIEGKMIPVPRHLSSDCGVCVRIARLDMEAAREVVEETGLEIEGIHEV